MPSLPSIRDVSDLRADLSDFLMPPYNSPSIKQDELAQVTGCISFILLVVYL